MIVYKIKREDGLFSMGGMTPNFNKVGKVWKQKGHLHNHLNQVDARNRNGFYAYDNCEVVIYELQEVQQGDGISIFDYLNKRALKKEQEEREYNERREKRQKEERHQQFLKLNEEFGNN